MAGAPAPALPGSAAILEVQRRLKDALRGSPDGWSGARK
jgi:hypothetical protein